MKRKYHEKFTYERLSLTRRQWADALGVNYDTFRKRVRTKGIEDAVEHFATPEQIYTLLVHHDLIDPLDGSKRRLKTSDHRRASHNIAFHPLQFIKP